MDIQVSGRKLSVGEALTDYIKDKLSELAEKYFNRSIDSQVTLGKEGHLYRVDCALHANSGIKLHARGEGDDPYGAFENAYEKLEKQLRRYKRRIKNHHRPPVEILDKMLINDAVIVPHDHEDATQEDQGDQPLIIAETKLEIPTVSVGDAVMLMDLADASAYMFKNSKTSTIDVVYKRPDGNIGWISPGKNA